MLGGFSPLLIIQFKIPALGEAPDPLLKALSKANFIGGVPIPLYLDERSSAFGINGVQVNSESKHIDIQTETDTAAYVEPSSGKAALKIKQKGLNSSITVDMEARDDSIILNILMALADKIYENVGYDGYSVSYFNQAITLFNAKFTSLAITRGRGDNLYNISMTMTYKTAEPKDEAATGGGTLPLETKVDAATLS